MDSESRKVYDSLFRLDPTLWAEIRRTPVADVVRRTEARFDATSKTFLVPFLNRTYAVDPYSETVALDGDILGPDEEFQIQLVLVTYLAKTGETVPMGRMVTEKDLKGGGTFFQGPHGLHVGPLLRRYGNDPVGFQDLGARFGAGFDGYGDASFTLQVLPKVPLGFILYGGDDEFPARMVVTFDSSIEAHFALDVIWALVNVAVEQLLADSEVETIPKQGERAGV